MFFITKTERKNCVYFIKYDPFIPADISRFSVTIISVGWVVLFAFISSDFSLFCLAALFSYNSCSRIYMKSLFYLVLLSLSNSCSQIYMKSLFYLVLGDKCHTKGEHQMEYLMMNVMRILNLNGKINNECHAKLNTKLEA